MGAIRKFAKSGVLEIFATFAHLIPMERGDRTLVSTCVVFLISRWVAGSRYTWKVIEGRKEAECTLLGKCTPPKERNV